MADEKKAIQAVVEKQDDFAARIAESVAQAVASATVKVNETIRPNEQRKASKESVYNPEGSDVRPKLKNEYVFCGSRVSERQLTNEEIETFNLIETPGEYRGGRWKVRVRKDDGGRKSVFIDLPHKNIDDRMAVPSSLMAILNEILAERKKVVVPA